MRRTLSCCGRRTIFVSALVFGLAVAFTSWRIGVNTKPTRPATIAEAAKVIDLQVFPILEGIERPPVRRLAELVYRVKGAIKPVFDFQKESLSALNFAELTESSVTEDTASATFRRDGFFVSATVSILDPDSPEILLVTLKNHGNLDLTALPVPEGARNLYATSVNIAYVTGAAVAETVGAIHKLLIARDWQPYGEPSGNWQEYKQNAVRLTVRVNSDASQGEKTVIEYASELMSADLPISPEFQRAIYTDPLKRLIFYTKQSPEDVVKFYRETLGNSDFNATLDKSGKLDSISYLIFRSAQNEMYTVEMQTMGDGCLRGEAWYHSAQEVEELDRKKRIRNN